MLIEVNLAMWVNFEVKGQRQWVRMGVRRGYSCITERTGDNPHYDYQNYTRQFCDSVTPVCLQIVIPKWWMYQCSVHDVLFLFDRDAIICVAQTPSRDVLEDPTWECILLGRNWWARLPSCPVEALKPHSSHLATLATLCAACVPPYPNPPPSPLLLISQERDHQICAYLAWGISIYIKSNVDTQNRKILGTPKLSYTLQVVLMSSPMHYSPFIRLKRSFMSICMNFSIFLSFVMDSVHKYFNVPHYFHSFTYCVPFELRNSTWIGEGEHQYLI